MGEKNICAYQCKDRLNRNVFFSNRTGFSLVELIAVIVILSILAVIVMSRYIDLDANARQRAIDAGIAELNGREGLVWSRVKISPTGYQDDLKMFEAIDKNLGLDYIWTAAPAPSGGEIRFGITGDPVVLSRVKSSETHPGRWSQ
jgi:prepilin-type N-terminal cleavage/methylation domain-containing protein